MATSTAGTHPMSADDLLAANVHAAQHLQTTRTAATSLHPVIELCTDCNTFLHSLENSAHPCRLFSNLSKTIASVLAAMKWATCTAITAKTTSAYNETLQKAAWTATTSKICYLWSRSHTYDNGTAEKVRCHECNYNGFRSDSTKFRKEHRPMVI